MTLKTVSEIMDHYSFCKNFVMGPIIRGDDFRNKSAGQDIKFWSVVASINIRLCKRFRVHSHTVMDNAIATTLCTKILQVVLDSSLK